jgi:hypothetical protein
MGEYTLDVNSTSLRRAFASVSCDLDDSQEATMPLKNHIHQRDGQPACRICGEPVNLQIAKSDEDGKAVHEECYVLKVKDTPKKT